MEPSITIYHSPDADDAFMFYGLTSGAITHPEFKFDHALKDIESLNQMARRGEIDCTAVSVHAFAYLNNQYVILNSGASMGGKDYGPRLIASKPFDIHDGVQRTIAIPGELTSAALAFKIYLREKGIRANLVPRYFDEVQNAIKAGEVDAGVIIHEGQLTHTREGFSTVLDLGQWWWEQYKLPLPLGVNVVRKSLGDDAIRATAKVLKATIEYSLQHRAAALDYALSYGRGISRDDADVFVGMYVNDLTIDMGEEGRRSIKLFLERGRQYELIPDTTAPIFV